MQKILITGAAGLIGSHFSTYALDKGYDVVGIDNLSGGYLDFVDQRLISAKKFHTLDLSDGHSLQQLFSKNKFDYVYHFAAYAAEGLSPFIRNFNYTNNLICSVNVINNCIEHDVKKIIFSSSMAVYGAGQVPFREDQMPAPVDPYGIAKLAVEMDIRQAHDQFGLKYDIVRPHNVIGIKQNIWDKYRNVIGIWIRESIAGRSISIFGDGKQKRAFSDIDYCMQPFLKFMSRSECGIFNMGADKEYEIKEIALLVQQTAKRHNLNPEIVHVESRHEVKNAYSDHSKAKRELDFKDNTDINATISEMFEWAVKQPVRKTKNMAYEIDKNIYPSWK